MSDVNENCLYESVLSILKILEQAQVTEFIMPHKSGFSSRPDIQLRSNVIQMNIGRQFGHSTVIRKLILNFGLELKTLVLCYNRSMADTFEHKLKEASFETCIPADISNCKVLNTNSPRDMEILRGITADIIFVDNYSMYNKIIQDRIIVDAVNISMLKRNERKLFYLICLG